LEGVAPVPWSPAVDRWIGSSLLGIAVFAALLLAYHSAALYAIGQVLDNGPEAYIVVVAITAIALAAHLVATERPPVPIHDRQTDYIVGGAFLGIGIGSTFLAAQSLGESFLVARLDLLTLPLTAVGATAVVFGVRRAWTVRWAIAYLWLAWPGLAQPVAEGVAATTELAAAMAIDAWSAIVPTAPQIVSDSDGVFAVALDTQVALVQVGPDWSGGGLLFVFVLVGVGALASLEGQLVGRMARLLGVLAAVWAALLLALQVDVVHSAMSGAPIAATARQPLLAVGITGIVLVGALALGRGGRLRLRPRGVQSVVSPPAHRPSRAVLVVALAAVILAVLHGGTGDGGTSRDHELATTPTSSGLVSR
jgi:hypothetical protein